MIYIKKTLLILLILNFSCKVKQVRINKNIQNSNKNETVDEIPITKNDTLLVLEQIIDSKFNDYKYLNPT